MLPIFTPARRKLMLMSATALAAGLAGTPAFAQTVATPSASTPSVPAATPVTQDIVVTGTRIQNTNANAANPLTVITSKEIAQSSAQTVEDVLQKIPAIGSSGIYGTTNNGGTGLSCTDIRNLGISRVLVLVDGHRFVHDSDGVADCVDINNIPLNMVDHIEVLKDGASSIYGADAVSGVVNIITKKNFAGTTATLDGNLPTRAGGRQGEFSITSGQNFDTGNFTLGFDYLNRSPVLQGSRNWANRVNSGYVGSTGNDIGSGSIPFGRIAGIQPNTDGLKFPGSGGLRVTGDDTAVKYHGSTDSYDFAPAQDLVGGLEKEALSATGHVDFNEYMTGYVEAFFTHKTTTEQLAPEPFYTNSSAALPLPYYVVPAGNPYLTSLTVNGVPFSTLYPGQNALVRERFTAAGPREYSQNTNTLQLTGGIRGTLPYDVDYDTYYNFGTSYATDQTKNSANIANLESEIGYVYTPATFGTGGSYDPSVCPSFGCADPFNLSNAAAKFGSYTQVDTSHFNLRTYGIDFSKKDVFQLPYGSLGLAFGFDHREEQGQFNTDNLVATGLTNESPQQPTAGSFNVNEVYGEARIPILADVPFAKDLALDISGRYFDYNTFGSGETWKVGGNWTPVSDLRFRAAIGTSFRQPSVQELYTAPVNSAISYSDPCSTGNGPLTAVVAANCARQGVPTGFVSANTQLNTLIGGNPNLQPETARNESLGVVIKPRWVPNSALTIDYWRTKINNSISSVPLQSALNSCYSSVNLSSPLCADIGGRDVFHELINATTLNQNLGVTKTDGIDVGLTYNLPLGEYGAISLNNDLEYVRNFKAQNVPNGPFIQYNGLVQDELNGDAYPRVKDNNTITWSNGPLTLGYTARFISGMNWQFGTSCAGTLSNGNPDFSTCRVHSTPNVFYHDIEATYNFRQMTVTAGVDNILDLPPPFVDDDTTNTAPEIYDVVGRTVYLKLSAHF